MPFAPATPHSQPTYQSMQFDGTVAEAVEIAYAIDSAIIENLLIRAEIEVFQDGALPQWRIRLNSPDGSDQLIAEAGAWIVVSSTGKIRVLEDAVYRAEFVV